MFDIGFSELSLIFLIGLLVLGPRRLPVAIRTVMGWLGAIRNMASNVQNELKQELKLQELQESIKKAEQLNLQQIAPELNKTVEELKVSAQKIRDDLEKKAQATNTTLEQQIQEVKSAVSSQHHSVNSTSSESQLAETTEQADPHDEIITDENHMNPPVSLAELAEQAE